MTYQIRCFKKREYYKIHITKVFEELVKRDGYTVLCLSPHFCGVNSAPINTEIRLIHKEHKTHFTKEKLNEPFY